MSDINTTLLNAPKFYRTQYVCFIGGEGIIHGSHAETGKWTYLIEMALGPEPICGRVGAETMVVLNEADLQAGNSFQHHSLKLKAERKQVSGSELRVIRPFSNKFNF